MKQEIKNFNLKIKGQGQLINNDCLAGMKNLPDNCIDLVLTDPPYGIANKNLRTWVGASKNGGKSVTTQEAWGNDFQDSFGDANGFWEWFKPFMAEMSRVTKDGGSIILFLDVKYIGHYLKLIEEEFGLKFRNGIYFVKKNPGPGLNKKGYRHACEQAIWFTKGTTPFNFNFLEQKDMLNVFSGAVGSNKETKHPCEKYKWMIEPLIERHSHEGQLLLDPFGGSASTLVYGIQKGRKVIAFEKSEKFFQMAKERVEKHGLDVLFYEPNKKVEAKKVEVKQEDITDQMKSQIEQLDVTAKKQVQEFIDSLLKSNAPTTIKKVAAKKMEVKEAKAEKNDRVSGIISELASIKTNLNNDYMGVSMKKKINQLKRQLSRNLTNKEHMKEELSTLAALKFDESNQYCHEGIKAEFVEVVSRIEEKFMELA
ncbi:site-specific DNA-methyltransferase [Burkholderia stagnalis]|uniref:Methyltransferase n=1 Tax=Burkholderia stagnalis TaxID=1503054 RepID=A0A6L3N5L2_9BURK|nr:site-specific DNA-methyltransferase [Burkholderia stagnalis]KAB0640711.1 site-specific DNA-methyltransferase [Burkholderia stagnalis]VWB06915.1 DNA methylase N-4/N-6 domain-containing protein [Burkholderia stagnalis]